MTVYLGKSSVAKRGDATGSGDTCARPRDPPSAISSYYTLTFKLIVYIVGDQCITFFDRVN